MSQHGNAGFYAINTVYSGIKLVWCRPRPIATSPVAEDHRGHVCYSMYVVYHS